jgi:hypothetical protein
MSYRIVYKRNRAEFRDLMKGIPTPRYKTSDPVNPATIRGSLRRYAEKRWNPSQLVWKRLLGEHQHPILEVTTPMGKCIIMRNGNDLGAYNFLVMDHQYRMYFCQNCLEACELVDILRADPDQLPLFFGQIDNPRLLTVLEKRLRHVEDF